MNRTIPHPLHASSNSTICLITVNPQRQYKDIIASDAFPAALRSRITRIIDLKKLKAKYKSFESRRQLRDSHDIFLADDRIVTELPLILGKSFYKQTAKRPIPVNFAPPRAARNKAALTVSHGGSDSSSKKSEETKNAPATAPQIAHEITRTLSQVLIHLSPSTCTAVRIGLTSFTPQQVAENVQAVVAELVDKFVPKGWRGVRSLHIKGPETMALPIWLAEELWVDENDIIEAKPLVDAEAKPELDDGAKQKRIKAAREPLEQALKDTAAEKTKAKDKKRKAEPLDQTLKESTAAEKAAKKAKKRKMEPVEQVPLAQALNPTTNTTIITATETTAKKIKKRKPEPELEQPLMPVAEAGNPKKARKDGKKKDKAEALRAGKKGRA